LTEEIKENKNQTNTISKEVTSLDAKMELYGSSIKVNNNKIWYVCDVESFKTKFNLKDSN
jgi:hypothetical protein